MGSTLTARRVRVLSHAIESYRARRPLDRRSTRELRNVFAAEVAAAFAAGRTATRKTRLFGLYRERGSTIKPHQRFVWDADEQLGWIVACEDELVVVTTLTRSIGRRKLTSPRSRQRQPKGDVL